MVERLNTASEPESNSVKLKTANEIASTSELLAQLSENTEKNPTLLKDLFKGKENAIYELSKGDTRVWRDNNKAIYKLFGKKSSDRKFIENIQTALGFVGENNVDGKFGPNSVSELLNAVPYIDFDLKYPPFSKEDIVEAFAKKGIIDKLVDDNWVKNNDLICESFKNPATINFISAIQTALGFVGKDSVDGKFGTNTKEILVKALNLQKKTETKILILTEKRDRKKGSIINTATVKVNIEKYNNKKLNEQYELKKDVIDLLGSIPLLSEDKWENLKKKQKDKGENKGKDYGSKYWEYNNKLIIKDLEAKSNKFDGNDDKETIKNLQRALGLSGTNVDGRAGDIFITILDIGLLKGAPKEYAYIITNILQKEGLKLSIYEDHTSKKNKKTKKNIIKKAVGVGHNLVKINDLQKFEDEVNSFVKLGDISEEEGKKIIKLEKDLMHKNYKTAVGLDECKTLFKFDLIRFKEYAKDIYKDFWDDLDPRMHLILIEMCFNLGKGGLLKFIRFKKALNPKTGGINYKEAIKEMINSKWYRQNTNRAKQLIEQVKEIIKDKNK